MHSAIGTSAVVVLLMVPPATGIHFWLCSQASPQELRTFLPTGRGDCVYLYVSTEAARLTVKLTPDWPVEPGSKTEAAWATCRDLENPRELFHQISTDKYFCGAHYVVGTDELFDDSGCELDRRGWAIVLPYPLLTLVLGMPLLRRLLRGVPWIIRVHRGRCPACGYDLRASPYRCPECGRMRSTRSNSRFPKRALTEPVKAARV